MKHARHFLLIRKYIIEEVRSRGVHGPVRSGFNQKIQPNRKIIFFINTTRTEPVLFGSGRFFSKKTQKNRTVLW